MYRLLVSWNMVKKIDIVWILFMVFWRIFIYYGVMTFTGALGKGGAMPTLLAALSPDLLGIIAGLYLNWRVSK